MADSYDIVNGKVVPYYGGRKDLNTDSWRDPTPLELRQQEELAEAESAIDALRAELAEQCRLHAIGMERELALIGRADRAEAEAESLRADAERYRWLRDSGQIDPDLTTEALADAFRRYTGGLLDAAIDAARKGE